MILIRMIKNKKRLNKKNIKLNKKKKKLLQNKRKKLNLLMNLMKTSYIGLNHITQNKLKNLRIKSKIKKKKFMIKLN